MDTQQQLLQEIESEWPAHIRHGLTELIRRNPHEQFYAAAFWIFYCDYTKITPPTFGVNAESMLEDEAVDETSNRWQPAEWYWDVLQSVSDGMAPFYQRLSEAMAGASDAEWQAVIAANEELIGRVARLVTKAVRSRSGDFRDLALPDNFVVFAVDVREDASTYNRLLRLSVDEAILATLDGILAPED
jgi:hypothetical protein